MTTQPLSSSDLTALAERTREATPFWSDDFDMDLPKIFPEARKLMGDLADVPLVASGRPDKNGRLNHPNVWNGGNAMLAFFGFKSPAKDTLYHGYGEVNCTAWDAFRDAWPHHYLIHVERYPIWDTGPLWTHFETIMWSVRGWGNRTEAQVLKARRAVLRSYCDGVRALGHVVNMYPDARAALSPKTGASG